MYNGKIMGSYYYVKDKNSDFGYTPVPEEEYVEAVFCIAKKYGLKITDEMVLGQIRNLTRRKINARISVLKSPALVR